jgi:hypothetical protein
MIAKAKMFMFLYNKTTHTLARQIRHYCAARYDNDDNDDGRRFSLHSDHVHLADIIFSY